MTGHGRWMLLFLAMGICFVGSATGQELEDLIDSDAGSVGDVDAVLEGVFGGSGVLEQLDSVDPEDILSEIDVDRPDPSIRSYTSYAPVAGMSQKAAAQHHKLVNQALYALDARKRASAARALGRNNDVVAGPVLLVALLDRNAGVREAAAEALRNVGNAEAMGALRSALSREVDSKAAKDMSKAMSAILERTAPGKPLPQPLVIVCHSCGRKFAVTRGITSGYCPYDGVAWAIGK